MAGPSERMPITCPSCSLVVSIGGGRCPECGHLLPTQLPSRPFAPDSQGAPVRPSFPSRGATSGNSSQIPSGTTSTPLSIARAAWPWLAFATAIVLAWVWLRPPKTTEDTEARPAVASSASPAAPADSEIPAPAPDALDPDTVLARATSKSLEWNRDAQLVEITVAPVTEGKVDARNGGSIQMRFGAPAGRRLGPGAEVSPDQLLVRVDDKGDHVERFRGDAGRGLAPPACGFGRAWRSTVASGVPSSSRVEMHFAWNKGGERAVWTAQTEGSKDPSRTLDGSSCAIISRR